MATTTPNFGWAVPTSTDLVKDGAVAIETLGDSIDASLVDLKGGTTGQVLSKASNTDMDFTWATPAAGGGGKVLQVVYATTSTSTNIATTTLTDTGITATITPTASTSKILVLVAAHFFADTAGTSVGTKGRLLRASTTIADYPDYGFSFLTTSTSGQSMGVTYPVNYLDSPATTSATTYKWQAAVRVTTSGTTCDYQYLSTPSSITLLEIGA